MIISTQFDDRKNVPINYAILLNRISVQYHLGRIIKPDIHGRENESLSGPYDQLELANCPNKLVIAPSTFSVLLRWDHLPPGDNDT